MRMDANRRQFQGVPRQALDHLLPSGSTSRPTKKPKMETITHVSTQKSRAQTETIQRTMIQKVVALPEAIPMVSSRPNLATRALEIVAEEIGLSASELEPSSDFVELGVDSLLSLTASSRLREELELDVPSSLFADYPTIKDLTAFLRQGEDIVASTRTASTSPTPETETESDGYQTDQTDPSDLDDINVMASFRCILAEEIGIPVNELKGSSEFAELGLDSLLSLTVLARLREELNLELSSSLLSDNNSLDEVEAALGLKREHIITTEGIRPTIDIHVSKSTISSIPEASSLTLQGNPKVATKILFLFPDGSGSATSYAPLPPISSDIVVYGLNCPYMKTPQDMKCSLEALTLPYLTEIRRRQPHGPYYLGGWSAGGICAFDAAQELSRCGDTVARLILIDSPFPIGLEKLPPRLYDFFSSISLFGTGEPPKWLIPHFLAFVDSLDKYRAKPFAAGRGPKTHIVWAKDGVCKNAGDPRPKPRADDPREMNWLLNNRTDFGPNGWDGLLGGAEVVVETLENANHFSLMGGEKAVELARFVERAMG